MIDEIDAGLRELREVAGLVARIALEIFLRAELGGIDEDRGDDARRVALGDGDQRQMPGMERAHGRHQRNGLAGLPPFGDLSPQVLYGSDCANRCSHFHFRRRGWSLLGSILDFGSGRYDRDQDRKMRGLRTRVVAMGEPRVEIAERLSLPDRRELNKALLGDEETLVAALIERARASEDEQREIAGIAEKLVLAARAGRRESGGVDSFLHEYGLSSREGVLLLCLAEALLRIPDAATADRLIAGTIGSGDWARHLGQSSSLLVNASTYGLMLTGRVIDWGEGEGNTPGA